MLLLASLGLGKRGQQPLVQNDAGPAVAAESRSKAFSNHMNERNEHFREQYIRLQHVTISGASRLRLELLQGS